MKQTTAELQLELDSIIDWFESDSFDIDESIKKYERGQELIKEISQRLKETKNTIKKLKVTLD